MIKKIYILFIVSILGSSVFGQFVGKDNLSVSLFYMQKSELDSAKKYIDLSINDDDLKSSAKTWYYRGFIYKELYKSKEKDNKTSPFRLTSIEAFKKLLNLSDNAEFLESSNKILKYLASTLYNDAARLLDPENYKTSIANYDEYRNIMLMLEPGTDFKPQDIKFKLALASMLNRPAETEAGLDSSQTNQIKKLYMDILSMDQNNPTANYNLGILYYNEAVDIINNMDYDMDIEKLNEVQDHCIEIFLQALPYMKKADEMGYKAKETKLGLQNIYYGLNDMEKSDMYKNELEYLENEEQYDMLNMKIKELEGKGMKDSEECKQYTAQKQEIWNKFKERNSMLKTKIKELEEKNMKNSEEYKQYSTALQNLLNKFKDLEKE